MKGSGLPLDRMPGEWCVEYSSVDCPPTPAEAFRSLFAGHPRAFWLDSARTAYGLGRFSYLGSADQAEDGLVRYRAVADEVALVDPDGRARVATGDLFEVLEQLLELNPVDPGMLDVPFLGGYVGYFGYGVKQLTGHAPAPDPCGPDAEWLHVSRFVAYDHEMDRAWAIAIAPGSRGARADAKAWTVACRGRLEQLGSAAPRAGSARLPAPQEPVAPPSLALSSVSRAEYLLHLDQIRGWLHDGLSYEACYTYQLRFPLRIDAHLAHLALRAANPAPYSAFLRTESRTVISCSPEQFLKISASGWAETRPIKGTSARADNPDADRTAAERLALDPKTRSESLMIVDLLRNDLGRLCSAGSVSVPSLMSVESYATVHQLVSTVRGRLRPGVGAIEAVRVLFPGGSMTGAPKIRTVQMLNDLEPVPRGVYSGALGFLSRSGAADLSIVIRTAVVDGTTASVGTGGAITVLSDPEAEYAETLLKAGPLLRVLGASLPTVDRAAEQSNAGRQT